MAIAQNQTYLYRYFAERGTWDDTLETFINSDGDPSQFAVSLSEPESRVRSANLRIPNSPYQPLHGEAPFNSFSRSASLTLSLGSSSSVSLASTPFTSHPQTLDPVSLFSFCSKNDTSTPRYKTSNNNGRIWRDNPTLHPRPPDHSPTPRLWSAPDRPPQFRARARIQHRVEADDEARSESQFPLVVSSLL